MNLKKIKFVSCLTVCLVSSIVFCLQTDALAYQYEQVTNDLAGYNMNAHINNQGGITWDYSSDYYMENPYAESRIHKDGEISILTSQMVLPYGSKSENINANGHIAWSASDGHDSEIFFYNGHEIIQITDNDVNDIYPKVNLSDQIGWSSKYYTAYNLNFFDGEKTIVVGAISSPNSFKINDRGDFIWPGPASTKGVSTYAFISGKIRSFPTRVAQLNNKGQVAWLSANATSANHLFFDDGFTVKDFGVISGVFDLNNNGHIAYTVNYQPYIYLYDGSTTTNIPASNISGSHFTIIDNNSIVWKYLSGFNDWKWAFYDGHETKTIGNADGEYAQFEYNNNNQFAWMNRTENRYFLYLYDGNQTNLIHESENMVGGKVLTYDMNDNGELAWTAVPLGESGPQMFTNAKRNANEIPEINEIVSGNTYTLQDEIVLGAQVSDQDGDEVTYSWKEGTTTLCSGIMVTTDDGAPVYLPSCQLPAGQSLGIHIYGLEINDSFNGSVTRTATITVKDSQAPTMAPTIDKSILWPPSHEMVDVAITSNATDDSGCLSLDVEVSSNEYESDASNGDKSPDFSAPQIDPPTGNIFMQLRAERNGSGNGRVYQVTIIATDCSGNSSSTTLEVICPHDKKNISISF